MSKAKAARAGVVQHGELQADRTKAQAKELFETTDLSFRFIAQRLGIKSQNTIVRWQKKENWTRDPDGNRARIVREALDQLEAERVQPAARKPRGRGPVVDIGTVDDSAWPEDEKPRSRKRKNVADQFSGTAPSPEPPLGVHNVNERREAGGSETASQFVVNEPAFSSNELAASVETATISQLHVMTVKRQLHAAERLQRIAGLVLDRLEDLMTCPLQPGVDDADGNVARGLLGSFGTDSLAGIMKGVSVMMNTGVTIERRAMGQDTNHDPLGPQRAVGQVAFATPPDAEKLISSLPSDMLAELHIFSTRLAKLPQGPMGPVIDGESQRTVKEK